MKHRNQTNDRRGSVLPLVAVLIVFLLAMVAFAVDVGYTRVVLAELQHAADAGAHAGACELRDARRQGAAESEAQGRARQAARKFASHNTATQLSVLLLDEDIELGHWDTASRTFTANAAPVNAVRCVAQRNDENPQGPVGLFFARVLGFQKADIATQAAAVALIEPGGGGTRFLIDDEVIDSDEPEIMDLALRVNKPPEEIISDLDGDFFIDLHKYLPPGERLLVRTGQVGDEGLLDIFANEGADLPQYPLGPETTPFTHRDFLNIDESPNDPSQQWRYTQFNNMKNQGYLDPLQGVGRFNDPNRYAGLVNPDFIHVSPVYKSDISALDGVGDPVVKGVNAQGDRRGMIAFKIVDWQLDPRGGSYLPNLIIELVDPKSVNLDDLTSTPRSSAETRVRLVR